MLDALLYAVRDTVRAAGYGYGYAECELTDPSGTPPPRCGNVFVAVHENENEGGSGSGADNQFDERLGFGVTLTMRVTVPLDRVGDQLLSRNIERVPLAVRQGFYAKRDQLAKLLHMNWKMTVLRGQSPSSANDNLAAWATGEVYGFCEPARYRNSERVTLVGGEWFASDPEAEEVGLKSMLRFEGARRFQPQTSATGPFT